MDHLGLVAIGATLVVAGIALHVLLLVVTVEIPRREKRQRAALGRGFAVVAAVADSALVGRRAGEPAMEGRAGRQALHRRGREPQRHHHRRSTDGTVFGNGMYDGRFNTDLKHDTNGIVRPYAL